MELAFSKNRARSLGFSLRNARGMVDLTHEPTIRDSAFRFENIGKGSGFQLIRKGSSSQAKIRLPVFNAIGRQATKGKIRQGFELAFLILQASGKEIEQRNLRLGFVRCPKPYSPQELFRTALYENCWRIGCNSINSYIISYRRIPSLNSYSKSKEGKTCKKGNSHGFRGETQLVSSFSNGTYCVYSCFTGRLARSVGVGLTFLDPLPSLRRISDTIRVQSLIERREKLLTRELPFALIIGLFFALWERKKQFICSKSSYRPSKMAVEQLARGAQPRCQCPFCSRVFAIFCHSSTLKWLDHCLRVRLRNSGFEYRENIGFSASKSAWDSCLTSAEELAGSPICVASASCCNSGMLGGLCARQSHHIAHPRYSAGQVRIQTYQSLFISFVVLLAQWSNLEGGSWMFFSIYHHYGPYGQIDVVRIIVFRACPFSKFECPTHVISAKGFVKGLTSDVWKYVVEVNSSEMQPEGNLSFDPVCRWYSASSRRIQFHRVHVGDSGAVVTPFVQHRAGVRLYTSCYHLAESCVFNKQSLPPVHREDRPPNSKFFPGSFNLVDYDNSRDYKQTRNYGRAPQVIPVFCHIPTKMFQFAKFEKSKERRLAAELGYGFPIGDPWIKDEGTSFRRSDSGEGKQGTDYTSQTCPEEEEGKLKESNSSSILTDIDGTRPTFLGRSYRTHILPVKGRSGKTLICSSHPYRTLYRESVKEYETFAEGNRPEIDALQHNLGLGLASSKKEKASGRLQISEL
ncbi:hypothetical protein RYX36_023007 [Vicia faba]